MVKICDGLVLLLNLYSLQKDIAEMLGYKNTTKAMIDHIDDEDKITFEQLNSRGGTNRYPLEFPTTYSLN